MTALPTVTVVWPRDDADRPSATRVLDTPLIGMLDAAIRACDSDLVVLLPSLAEPAAGWLEVLQQTCAMPDVHAVTPRLVAPGGRLAAAGSVLWRDGTCERYGRADSAAFQEYSFRRDVPAAPVEGLCVRRSAFVACDGFDPSFVSTDYAFADLAMRLRAAGGRVVYQPRAVVGVPEVSGESSTMTPAAADRSTLCARHGEALAAFPSRPKPLTSVARLAARDALCGDRLLIVDDRVPGHDRGSGDPRMLCMLMDLVELWPTLRVTLAAQRPIEPERYARPLLDAGVEVIYGCPDWSEWFESRRYHYGIVMISKPQPIAALLRRTQPQAFRIYDAEALVFRRLERMLPFITDPAQARAVTTQLHGARNAESEYVSNADLVLCVSPDERRTARAIAECVPAVVIPHRVEIVEHPTGHADRDGLLYFGGFMGGAGSPNEDALVYLVSTVLPRLHAHNASLMLYVVGADPTPTVRALASDRIRVIGYVPDPLVWLERARVHVAPLRFGAGVKLKLIDTMAAGLPFVTTTVGAEGLRLGALRHHLVANTPEGLAELTIALYENTEEWAEAQRQLLRLVRRHFGRERFRRALAEAMSYAGIGPPPISSS